MPRLTAVEWDGREIRIAVARSRGKQMIVEQAFAVALTGESGGPPTSVAVRLAEVAQQRQLARNDVLVAVGRSNIELRQLTLPPVPPEELPDMVRLQAVRQFSAFADDWALDFVPIDSRDAESITVLAASLSPEGIKQIKEICEPAQLRATHMVLRPFAAASLLRAQKMEPAGCRMSVDMLAEEADLTVMVDNQVVFLRTVRLPLEEEAQPRALLGEIRRTIVAAQNQLGGRVVERLVLFAEGQDPSTLQELLAQNLTVPVELFDPFAGLEISDDLRKSRPIHAGRFAPLLGMLHDQIAEQAHAIDFLHPRRRPEPQNRRRQQLLLGGTVAAMLLAVLTIVWFQLRALDDEIADVKTEIATLNQSLKDAEKSRADLALVQQFQEGDINWLDRLHELTQKLPPAEEAILRQILMGPAKGSGGQMILEGNVARSNLIDVLERNLRDPQIRVVGSGASYDDRDTRYPWQFKEVLTISPELNQAPATTAAEAKSVGKAKSEPPAAKAVPPSSPAKQRQGASS